MNVPVKHPGPVRDASRRSDVGARLMLITLCFVWGTTWPVMKLALDEIPPLSMRAAAAALGVLTL